MSDFDKIGSRFWPSNIGTNMPPGEIDKDVLPYADRLKIRNKKPEPLNYWARELEYRAQFPDYAEREIAFEQKRLEEIQYWQNADHDDHE